MHHHDHIQVQIQVYTDRPCAGFIKTAGQQCHGGQEVAAAAKSFSSQQQWQLAIQSPI